MSLVLSSLLQNMSESATFAISDKAKKLKSEGFNVINLGVGEPDFNTPDSIKNASKAAIDSNYTRYTDVTGSKALREAIRSKLIRDNNIEYDISEICVSNGAKQSIYNTLKAIINKNDEIIVFTPAWVSYPEMIKVCGANPVYVECKKENNFIPDIEEVVSKITQKTKAILINSPCNPTGSVFPIDVLKKIANLAIEHNFYIISDEIYEKLIYDNFQHISIASLSKEIKDMTIVINGVSKAYAMTGYRIGYAAGPKTIISLMKKFQGQTTSCANSIAQYAAGYALNNDEQSCSKMQDEFKKRRDLICSKINSISGLNCCVPHGAFYLMVDVSSFYGKTYNGELINNSIDFCRSLLENEYVACVPGEPFMAPDYIRISYALPTKDIETSIIRIKKFVENIK